MNERAVALYGLWKEVIRIACDTEDSVTIRRLIAEAGIATDSHVGVDAKEFTPSWLLSGRLVSSLT